MARKKKRVFFYVVVPPKGMSFKTLIQNPGLEKKLHEKGSKIVEAKYIKEHIKEKVITGILVSTKVTGIPAKHKIRTNKFSKVGLEDEEGLSTFNIFLFDPRRNILAIEQDKNGAYVTHLAELVSMLGSRTVPVQIKFNPLLSLDAMNKILSMENFTSFSVKIASPKNLIKQGAQDASLATIAKVAIEARADDFEIIFAAGKKVGGMDRGFIMRQVNQLVQFFGENIIRKASIKGTAETIGNKKQIKMINLILDRLEDVFSIEEPSQKDNPQLVEREGCIKAVYERAIPEISLILGEQNEK